MLAWRSFQIAAWVVLIGGVGLSVYLACSRFRSGDGLVAELKVSPEKMVAVLRDFITVFAVLLAFQAAAFFWVLSTKQLSQGNLHLSLASALVFLVGLFWALTDIAVGLIGGVSLAPWHFSVLMVLLTVGISLT